MPDELEAWEVILRVVLAALLGASLGFEREVSEQPAGFRTHILVSVGAALFTLAGAYSFTPDPASGFRFDPTRVAAQVVTGIGFLGAGAIIKQGISIRGLTTAASLWVTASLGMGVALGYYVGTVTAAVVALTALLFLKAFKRGMVGKLSRQRRRLVVMIEDHFDLPQFARILGAVGARVGAIKIREGDEGDSYLVLELHLSSDSDLDGILHTSRDFAGVRYAEWSG